MHDIVLPVVRRGAPHGDELDPLVQIGRRRVADMWNVSTAQVNAPFELQMVEHMIPQYGARVLSTFMPLHSPGGGATLIHAQLEVDHHTLASTGKDNFFRWAADSLRVKLLKEIERNLVVRIEVSPA